MSIQVDQPENLVADKPCSVTHFSIYDAKARRYWAERFRVSEERLRKAVKMVGNRISTVADYLGQRVP
ncbi:DUF3606 domain-containing protein [Escherichia coli]|nr:DUF3606 domain-containing protein [Escherichia coli]